MPIIANTDVVIDRETHTIILTRMLVAPCAQVFDAWTRPEHVACWWDPTGEPLAECEIDLRPGGAFRFVNQHARDHAFAGVYREIAPPHRLVFETMGAIGRVNFDDSVGHTLLTVRIECGSVERLDQYLRAGIDAGTARTVDNLAVFVGVRPSGAPSARAAVLSPGK